MDTILKLENVTMEYSVRQGLFSSFKHRALNDVCLEIKKGETLGVLGKNGSGKSSLLQILAGLVEPTQGTLAMPLGKVTTTLLSLGLGFRADLSGEDNVIISLVLQGMSVKDAKSLRPQIQDFADLGDYFYQPVRTYSAGMRARLGFATGTCSKVDVLLIDEVLSVGDLEFRRKAETTMLDRIQGEQTVIFVSQSPQQVSSLCDRALWLNQSEIKDIGEPRQVARSYAMFMEQVQA